MIPTEPEIVSYPLGKFSPNLNADENEMKTWLLAMEQLPIQLRKAVENLNDKQLNTPYRNEGWTVRQVVHHVADSHMNAYIRFKLALTEDHPTIKPYLEKRWAEMGDSKNLPVEISLSLLDSLHLRMVYMLKNISHEDLSKSVFHPESKREMSVKFLMNLYSWHGKHHAAQITSLRERKAW